MRTCSNCDGSGTVSCSKCSGSGEQRNSLYIPVLSELSNTANDFENCTSCGGKGEKKCSSCRGRGEVSDD